MNNWDLVIYDKEFNQIKRVKGSGEPKPGKISSYKTPIFSPFLDYFRELKTRVSDDD
jgi:hypothetical protein